MICVVQARMNSKRLPERTMIKISGKRPIYIELLIELGIQKK